MNTEAASPNSDPVADPTLAAAERQLAMLGELALIAMAVSRASGAAAIASADAARMILAEEYFVPEVGRVRACGAKEAAEAFQKASRSLRLTLMLETATAELVRDLRAGIVRPAARSKTFGETPAVLGALDELDRRRPAGSRSDDRALDLDRRERDSERLYDVERLDRLPGGGFRHVVDQLAADIGAAVDWDAAAVTAPDLCDIAPSSSPPDRGPVAAKLANHRSDPPTARSP